MRKLAPLLLAAAVLPLAACNGANDSASPDPTATAESTRSSESGADAQPGTATAGDAPGDDASAGADGNDGAGGEGGDDAAAAPACDVTDDWTLHPDVKDDNSAGAVVGVRAGRHECFDRVVVDLESTDETGFQAEYVSEVVTMGRGDPVPVAGGAALKLTLYAPARGTPGGGLDREPLATAQEHLVPESGLAAWDTLRSVRYAGSFEAVTTIAVGAREKLPFRVFTQVNEQEGTHKVVLDIAHGDR